MASDISICLALASLLGTVCRAAAASFARGGQVFVDEAHCLKETATAVHQVLFRTAPGPPLAGFASFHLLLLRPLRPAQESGSASSDFEVVFARALEAKGDGVERRGKLCIDDAAGDEHRRPCMHVHDRAELGDEIAPERAFRVYFEDPLEGSPGDCLGWALDSEATGDILWSMADRSRSARTAWLQPGSAPLLGRRLAFGAYRLSSRPRVSWLVSQPLRSLALVEPRARRLQALRDFVRASPDVHFTSSAFQLDLVSVLAEQAWGRTAALEIGSNEGYTTQVLAPLFRVMFALDYYTYERLRARLAEQLDNVVYWMADSAAPFALRKLSASNLSFVFIDGNHQEYHVVRDTYAVLQDVACCVRLVAFHDYCMEGVYRAVRRFVEAKVLRFLSPLGLRRRGARFIPCLADNDRPEGALFEVVGRGSLAFRQAVEQVRRSFGSEEPAQLLGSSWLLVHEGLHGILTFKLAPESSELFVCSPRAGCESEARQVGGLRLAGWSPDAGSAFGAARLEASLVEGAGEEPRALVHFDRHLEGFLLSALGRPLAPGLPELLIGQKNSRAGVAASATDINVWASGAQER